jgi:hypothetical protein
MGYINCYLPCFIMDNIQINFELPKDYYLILLNEEEFIFTEINKLLHYIDKSNLVKS